MTSRTRKTLIAIAGFSMPKNQDFRIDILVGGVPQAEFKKDGQCFVECNLFTPYSYQAHTYETVSHGHEEEVHIYTQTWSHKPAKWTS